MNILAIDAGNTRIKWGVADGERWLRQSWVPSGQAAALGTALAGLAPERIVISNVAGSTVAAHIAAALAPFHVAPHWIKSEPQQCGVRSSYADPAQLGTDRWAGLIGAWHLFHGPCVVANAGTTMTVDALSGEGVFLGGFIVPGIELMRAALAGSTAQLRIEDGSFSHFPDRTGDAIMSGTINALVGSIERMLQFMAETGEGAALIVISGGEGGMLAPRLNARFEVVDNLILEGLVCIALGSSM